MAVSKRTRFEVLRRDKYTCRYCRSTENPLTVDHVTPVALGGTDDPANLVAACKDCNAGKSSSSPDAALVGDVRQDVLRHAELVRSAYAVLVERMGERNDYIDEFAEAYTYTPLPSAWRDSVGRWFEMGVPVELVVDAAEVACSIDRTFRGHDRFRYMCGIVWNQVRTVSQEVALREHFDGRWMTDEDLTEVRIDAYEHGANAERSRWWPDCVAGALLALVVDDPKPQHRGSRMAPADPLRDLIEAVGADG